MMGTPSWRHRSRWGWPTRPARRSTCTRWALSSMRHLRRARRSWYDAAETILQSVRGAKDPIPPRQCSSSSRDLETISPQVPPERTSSVIPIALRRWPTRLRRRYIDGRPIIARPMSWSSAPSWVQRLPAVSASWRCLWSVRLLSLTVTTVLWRTTAELLADKEVATDLTEQKKAAATGQVKNYDLHLALAREAWAADKLIWPLAQLNECDPVARRRVKASCTKNTRLRHGLLTDCKEFCRITSSPPTN